MCINKSRSRATILDLKLLLTSSLEGEFYTSKQVLTSPYWYYTIPPHVERQFVSSPDRG